MVGGGVGASWSLLVRKMRPQAAVRANPRSLSLKTRPPFTLPRSTYMGVVTSVRFRVRRSAIPRVFRVLSNLLAMACTCGRGILQITSHQSLSLFHVRAARYRLQSGKTLKGPQNIFRNLRGMWLVFGGEADPN